jgi:DNA-binding CsgD family transcriptional regulator
MDRLGIGEKELIKKVDRQLFQVERYQLKKSNGQELLLNDIPMGIQVNPKGGSCLFMNRFSREFLGYSLEEIQEMGKSYASTISYDPGEMKILFNKINQFYARNDLNEILGFFQRVIPRGKENYEWVYIASKLRTKPGEKAATERLVMACPVKYMGDMTHQIDKLLDDNYYFRNYFKRFAALTRREKEIISKVVLGLSNAEIGECLFISRDTVAQHRKNINRKLEFKTYYELIKFAEVFELI